MAESEDQHLERIFHPYAVEQMAAFLEKQPDPTQVSFVHYTSATAALQILEKKRVWMRSVTCMSDYSEVQHGFTLLNNALVEDNNKGLNALTAAVDECAKGAATEAIGLFNKWWTDIRLNTYITSISEHYANEDQHGRLSMWRAFGGTNVRVALVFKFPRAPLDAGIFNLLVSPVAYLAKAQVERELYRVVDNVYQNRDFLKSVGRERVVSSIYTMLVAGVTCLKHEGFREECEWRLIYAPVRGTSPLIEQERSTEVINGIPQVIYKIPFDANAPGAPEGLTQLDLAQLFHHMIIGPAIYPYSMIEAFATVLQKAGVSEPSKRIVASGIPIPRISRLC